MHPAKSCADKAIVPRNELAEWRSRTILCVEKSPSRSESVSLPHSQAHDLLAFLYPWTINADEQRLKDNVLDLYRKAHSLTVSLRRSKKSDFEIQVKACGEKINPDSDIPISQSGAHGSTVLFTLFGALIKIPLEDGTPGNAIILEKAHVCPK